MNLMGLDMFWDIFWAVIAAKIAIQFGGYILAFIIVLFGGGGK